MDRRTFVLTGTAGLAAAGIAAWSFLNTAQSDAWPKTVALIWEPDTIVNIGKKYRAAFPDEDSSPKLTSLLEPVMGVDGEAIVKGDFVAGRTVHVDGWILSLTEARQCALASLS